MELPFTGFELTFIIVAFFIFSLFSLASVFFRPQESHPDEGVCEEKKPRRLDRKHRVIMKHAAQRPC
ncbi:small integral membrane protein 31-like [Xyrichtys novacula]|uniref:Small integral membrane protein 31-like n=1 Tax=Xyrichtys novacula TaxID=13765 RepID=A0AAV1EUH9_XYRNO|nr:small integral membrane protein 31-like [Xyrichtys novacula]